MTFLTSRNTLQQTLDSQKLHIALLNNQGEIIYVNKAWRRFAEANDCIKESVSEGVNYLQVCDKAAADGDAIANLFADNFRKLVSGALSSFDFDYECHSPQEMRYFNCAVSKLINEEILGAVVSHQDITERKQAEIALKESENKYRHLYETMPQGVLIQDAQGKILEANGAAVEILGLTEDQLFGRTAYDPRWQLIHEDGSPFQPSEMASNIALRTGKSVRDITCGIYVPEIEEYRWILVGSSPQFKDDESKPNKIMTVFTDITKRKQTEEEISKLSTAVMQSPSLIVITDLRGKIEYINPQFTKITGYSQQEAIGQQASIVKSRKQPESAYKKLWESILGGDTWSGRFINRRKDGSEYTEEAIIFPIKNNSNKIIKLCKIGNDISHELALEEQLRRSQKLETIGTLAGGIAHDFNNMLTPILGYVDMALHNLENSNPLYHNLKQVLNASIRAKDLVEQILLFSKQSEKKHQPLALHSLVKEVLKLMRPSIPTTIKIQQHIDANCKQVLADASQIHQVLVNLCTNAWHSMEDKGGELIIELQQVFLDTNALQLHPMLTEGEYARLSVIDSGHGIEEPTIERIFEPFFTTKTVDKGTGLGLSVVHGIVRSHKGDIQVKSSPGRGSVFHVYLPVLNDVVKKSEGKTKKIDRGHESILVVDDDVFVAKLVKSMLEKLGYKVSSFNSSRDALENFRQHPQIYDLLISDLTMPEMTGLELAEQVQKVSPDFPVMIMTGYGEELNEDSNRTYGIRKVIGKPLEMQRLAITVRELLEK